MTAERTFDYVVVGGGSAGCVVSRRLLDAGASVALIEAGGPATNPAIHDPGRWPELLGAECDWNYSTEPQPACGGRPLYWPRGKVLGGSGAMNGMAYIRGDRLDYDGWAYHGCPGWSFADLLPIFKRSEDCDRGESTFRGAGGPLRVMTRYEPHPLLETMVGASQEAGLSFNDDHNDGGPLDGVGYSQLTIKDGVRQTAAAAFLEPVANHPDLTIYTDAHARRLRFSANRCLGVEMVKDGALQSVEARSEVVVCAGAIGSPVLLMLSGIGPADELRPLGITPLVGLPGVGKNLHDHLIAPVTFSARTSIPPRRPGLTQHHVHFFWRSRPGLVVPDTQPVCFHIPIYREGTSGPENAFTIVGGLVRPESRGEIRLRSSDPDIPPSLDPRCLSVEADLEALAASVDLCREIGRQRAFAVWVDDELYPGRDVRTMAQLRDYVRTTVASYHHQAGTCRMGQDEHAVVDPELRVRGVDGLRIADVSIMPFVTTGNTNAPAIMIGEKAADLILARRIGE